MIQNISNIKHKDSSNFFLIAGPCAIENEDMAMKIAERVITITDKLNIPYIFKDLLKKQIVLVLTVLLVLEMKRL